MYNKNFAYYNKNFAYYSKNRNKFKNTTKEERVRDLYNVICPVCKYRNKGFFIKKTGICHLCGEILDERIYFKNKLRRNLNGKGK